MQSVGSSSNAVAHKHIIDLFGGEIPIDKKYLGEKCPGCWVAKTSDGTSVTFRPAGTASGKTLETTASVDVNNPTIRSLNISKSKSPEVLKLKFPEIKMVALAAYRHGFYF